jgi:hypothetical protein
VLHPRLNRELGPDALRTLRPIRTSHRLRINPGGEVQLLGPIPEELIEASVRPENRWRLLSLRHLPGLERLRPATCSRL